MKYFRSRTLNSQDNIPFFKLHRGSLFSNSGCWSPSSAGFSSIKSLRNGQAVPVLIFHISLFLFLRQKGLDIRQTEANMMPKASQEKSSQFCITLVGEVKRQWPGTATRRRAVKSGAGSAVQFQRIRNGPHANQRLPRCRPPIRPLPSESQQHDSRGGFFPPD